MATGEAIAKRAFEQLESAIDPTDTHTFLDATLAAVWLEARAIEKEQAQRCDLRFMRRIEPLLKTLETYAGVLEVFCQGYPPMAFVWGPIKLMLQLARNYSSVMDKILQAFNDIAQVLPRLDKLKGTFETDANFFQVLALVYSDILEFNRRVYRFFRRKVWHFWFAFDWGLFERRFRGILTNLSSHCEVLDKEAAATHFQQMKAYREQRQDEYNTSERHRRIQMSKGVFDWLSDCEDLQEDYLHRVSDVRQPGTCNWIIEEAQVRSWIEEDCGDRVLWMHAIPGAGKTFLCSQIIQILQIRKEHSTLYFFCGQRPPGEMKYVNFLRTLICQLLRQNPSIVPLVHEAYVEKVSSRSGLAIKRVLIQILVEAKPTYVVIDGVDEFEQVLQEDILKNILDVQKQSECKILISSRDEPQIKRLVSSNTMNLKGKTKEALRLYIETKIQDLYHQHPDWGSRFRDVVGQDLQAKAKGMFLWVRLVINMLDERSSIAELVEAIKQLPEGLHEAYGRIISRIRGSSEYLQDRIYRIMYWACLTRRPVTIRELADGIILRSREDRLNSDTRIHNVDRDILETCAPLLELSNDGIVELVHFSAKEYFLHKESGPFVDQVKANLAITLSCTINLTACLELVPGFCNDLTENDIEREVMRGTYSLHCYADEFWTDHLMAFLTGITHVDSDHALLMQALEGLSRLVKHGRSHTFSHSARSVLLRDAIQGFSKLKDFPQVYALILHSLDIKLKAQGRRSGAETVEVQQQWLLQADDTHLTHISCRLHEITERLLSMDAANLPTHIDHAEYQNFTRNSKLLCRYNICRQAFASPNDRNVHEMTHLHSFHCQQCDFSIRGFRTRRDLDRHVRNYHYSPEEFDIPTSIYVAGQPLVGANGSTPQTFSGFGGRLKCWNEQGRKAISQGLRKVLQKVKTDFVSDVAKNPLVPSETLSKDLENMSRNIESQRYDNLAEFKRDLAHLFECSYNPALPEYGDIDKICARGLEEGTSSYPAFVNHDWINYEVATSERLDYDVRMARDRVSAVMLELGVADENQAPGSMTTYWSIAEKDEFPNLLLRWGLDFVQIADYLQTKTAEEVDSHYTELLRSGRSDLLDMVKSRADAIVPQSQNSEPPVELFDLGDTNLAPKDHRSNEIDHNSNSNPPPVVPAHLVESPVNYNTNRKGPQSSTVGQTSEKLISQEVDAVVTKKRRPRLRYRCPYCNVHSDGLHDEYAAKKHIARFHNATRKVWVCNDISLDHTFLGGCKTCPEQKGYSSRHIASKHLRAYHFSVGTSTECLHRWIREIEEPNPRYQKPLNGQEHVDTHTPKRQKIDEAHYELAPVPEFVASADLLPPMMTRPPSPMDPIVASDEADVSSSTDDEVAGQDGNELQPNQQNLTKTSQQHVQRSRVDAFIPDISFDNMLPGHSQAKSIDIEGPPHRTNRSLVRLEHVSRLTHLDSFHRTACTDQVEALYQRLDKERPGSREYGVELRKLESLSRFLMRELVNWRRNSKHAPDIPFSI